MSKYIKSVDYKIRTLEKNNHELLEANIKFADELKWAIEDKERLERIINIAKEYIKAEKTFNNDTVKKAIEKYEKLMLEILNGEFYDVGRHL